MGPGGIQGHSARLTAPGCHLHVQVSICKVSEKEEKEKKGTKKKVYAVRRHNGSLCPKRQPENVAKYSYVV